MYVVDVIPFAPGAPAGSLSYRSASELPLGSIVLVKLRKREVPAVVVRSINAVEAKAMLKAASFALSGTISEPIGKIPDAVMEAVAKTAAWHASGMGSVLAQLLGEWISPDGLTQISDAPGTGFLLTPVECALSVRKSRYRTTITENEKLGRATLLVVSTLAEVAYWQKAFSDLDPVVLSGALKEKKRALALEWARASKSLVIATPTFAFAQIAALDTIVIERVGAGGFRFLRRPYLDIRVALMELAQARKLTLILGDFPLPLEYRAGARKLGGKPEPVSVIDTREDREEGEAWSAVPKSLKERIAAELLEGGRVAVFAARKGYAPVVICRDCGEALRDERGKVFAFTQEGGKRIFRTSDGKRTLATDITCPKCSSWNLMPLGVGVERVAEELARDFPESKVELFDSDTVRTSVGAGRRLSFLKEPGAIVVGTEAMAPWLLASSPAPLSLAAIASADTLLALPFWRARERFLRLGFLLSDLAPRAALATRLPEDATVKTLRDPDDTAFFEEEGSLRSALGYPPFGTLISFTFQGTEPLLDKVEAAVRSGVGDSYTLRGVPDRPVRNLTRQRTLVLSLPKDVWPDAALSDRLSTLPPSVRVLLDPESFW